ncbi:MAG TPA: hypothetical protein VEL76_37090 [Gemmataceae bacterium]|nr:hypothetical protein [Gemmataceae bacterium]
MRNSGFLFAALLGLGVSLGGLPQGTAVADDDNIAKLVKQLGSSKFTERDKAKRALEALGAAALPALKQAAESPDLETSRRAGELVKKLEEKVTIENLLAPKRVRLQLKDTPVLEAVAQLAKQSGYNIEVQGDRTKLADRKITLDTGDTTFWQAFDQLCQKAGLTETNQVNPYQPVPGGGPIRIQPAPIQIQPLPIQPAPRPIQIQPGRPIKIQPLPAPGVLPVQPPANPVPAPVFQANAVQVQGGIAVQVAAPGQPVQAQQGQAGQAQAQPGIQIQVVPVQAQPVQAVPVQVQPAIQPVQGGRVIAPRPLPVRGPAGQINLVEGKPQEVPTCYSGAVRIRALPKTQQPGQPPQARQAGEALITLEIAVEPRLISYFNITSTPQIAKAIDDLGQMLSEPMNPMPINNVGFNGVATTAVYRPIYSPYNALIRYTTIRLKLGEKQAKKLTELSGHVPVQMLAPPQTLLSVDNVLKAAGKSVKGANGGAIEVVAIDKQDNGDYKVQIRFEQPPTYIPVNNAMPPVGAMPAVQIQAQNGVALRPTSIINNNGLPTLVDAKGQSLQLVQIPARMFRGGLGVATQEITMVFRAPNGVGEPARMVLQGQRPMTVQVPFALNNVPLP